MKKIILICLLLFFPFVLIAKDYYVIASKNYKEDQIVYFTKDQKTKGAAYTIFITKTSKQNPNQLEVIYAMAFHSRTNNEEMYYLSKDCFENIDYYIKNTSFEKMRISNGAIKLENNQRIWFESGNNILGYTDFR